MHNCAVGPEVVDPSPDLYRKDVTKFVDRYNLHPDFARALVVIYQSALHRFEAMMEEQGKKIAAEPRGERTGRSRAESAEVLAEFVQVMKRQAREFLEKHASRH